MSDATVSSRDDESDEGWEWPDIQALQAEARKDESGLDWPPNLRRPIQRYVDNQRATATDKSSTDRQSHTRQTVDDYMQDWNWFEMWLRLNDVDIDDVAPYDALDIGTYLGNNYSGSVAGTRYRNIKFVYQFLVKGETLKSNPFTKWEPRDLGINENKSEQSKRIEETDERYGPTLDEIDQMVANVDLEYQTRDRLVIRLFRDTGCRVNELRQIKREDIDFEEKEIDLPDEICKYNKGRVVIFKRETAVLLRDWIDKYRIKEAYKYSEYLFPTDQSPIISTDTLEKIVSDAATNAGLNRDLWVDGNGNARKKVTPHNLRYATGYYMLFDDNDEPREDDSVYDASRYLGHSSVTTTERIYIEDNPRAGVGVAKKLIPE